MPIVSPRASVFVRDTPGSRGTKPDTRAVGCAGRRSPSPERTVGRSIARELIESDHDVSLIERNADHIDVDAIPGAHWRLGDACELSLFRVGQTSREFDVVIAATGDDKANVVLSLLAKTEFAVSRVVALVNDPRNEWLFDESWGVDVAVSTPRMLASLVEEAVSIGDLVRIMEFRKGAANLVEITLPDDTPGVGVPSASLNCPGDAALVTILRGGNRVIVPEPDEPLEGGDELAARRRCGGRGRIAGDPAADGGQSGKAACTRAAPT